MSQFEAVVRHARADLANSPDPERITDHPGILNSIREFVSATVGDALSATVYSHAAMDIASRGASELANALFTGSAYGPGTSSVYMSHSFEGDMSQTQATAIYGAAIPNIEAPAIEAAPAAIAAPHMEAAGAQTVFIEAPPVEAPRMEAVDVSELPIRPAFYPRPDPPTDGLSR